ncbi:GspE/PulE family protein [Pyruvatibacter mobilis]|uniref:GspE/PulE family protein n=1 Tax=Pyruvatibacter mobilis TaxID=1712261 RepID=UPI003BA96F9D
MNMTFGRNKNGKSGADKPDTAAPGDSTAEAAGPDATAPRDAAKPTLNIHDLGLDLEGEADGFAEQDSPDEVDLGIERLIRSAGAAPKRGAQPADIAGASVTPISAARPAAARPEGAGRAGPTLKVTDAAIAEEVAKADNSGRRPTMASLGDMQRPLGERLVELGYVTRRGLDTAIAEQERNPHKLLGKILSDLDLFTDEVASVEITSAHDPLHTLIDPEAIKLAPEDLIRTAQALPVSRGGGAIMVALSHPREIDQVELLRPYLPAGTRIEPCFWPKAALAETIEAVLDYEMSAERILKGLARGSEARGADATVWTDPAVRLVNAALLDAIRAGASHAHFEPVNGYVRLRYRVDGAMQQSSSIDKRFWAPVAAHLRAIAGLGDTTAAHQEGSEPGEFTMRLGGRIFLCALKTFDTLNGERMTIRLGEIARDPMSLGELGLSDHSAALVLRSLVRPSGMIVVAGGRASGRTTTLYGMLGEMKAAERSIFTVERRIGYRLPLVSQLEVTTAQANNPETLIDDVIAQDPDVLLFDKIEDGATARSLANAASAGRLVMTSMDAPDSLSALIELIGMVDDPRQLAGRITTVMAQRLVRRLCSVCKQSRLASADECFIFGLDPTDRPTVYHPNGCPSCRSTGYRGRTVISEVLNIDDDMNDLIAEGAPIADLRAAAASKGFQTLAEDGVRKVLMGEVSPGELARAVDLAARL